MIKRYDNCPQYFPNVDDELTRGPDRIIEGMYVPYPKSAGHKKDLKSKTKDVFPNEHIVIIGFSSNDKHLNWENDDTVVYVKQRAVRDGDPFSGQHTPTVSAHVSEGELYVETAKREFGEEIPGFNPNYKQLNLVGKADFERKVNNHIVDQGPVIVFTYKFDDSEISKIQADGLEAKSIDTYRLGDLKKMIASDEIKEGPGLEVARLILSGKTEKLQNYRRSWEVISDEAKYLKSCNRCFTLQKLDLGANYHSLG